MVHLIPGRINYNARQMAELMFEEVYKHHGIPINIISDRDVLFTSVFWEHLHGLLGSKLRMSSAYHPQTDGATERANRTVTQMLRQCVNTKQTDWVAKLPAIEFAINSARSESTGFAPFFLNTGRMPRSMLFNFPIAKDEYPSVRNFAILKRLALMAAHDSIIAARIKQTRDANRKRRVEPFVTGDLVYVSTKNISFPKGLAKKLIPKYIGPYEIKDDYKNHSFEVELSKDLKSRGIRGVFHASLLRVHIPNDDRLFPGRLDTQLGTDETFSGEWAVDRILSHSGSGQNSVFEVKWAAGDVTWLPGDRISDLQALNAYLDLLGIEKISDLPKGDGNPPGDDPQVYLGAVPSATHHISSKSFKSSKIFRSILSPLSSLFHSCLPSKKTLKNFDDDSIIYIDPDMVPPPSKLGNPPDAPDKPVHPLIELTAEGDFFIKTAPDDNSTEEPRGLTYTKNMITDYVAFSDLCLGITLNGDIEESIKLRARTPAGYNAFANHYNSTISDFALSQFTVYDTEVDAFIFVASPIDLTDFGIKSKDKSGKTSASNSSTKPRNRKPYAKPFKANPKNQPSLTSFLQQTRNLRGVDGLLADLLITSASQNASRAKMGTLHFGIRDSKRRDPKYSNHAKHRNSVASSSGSVTPTSSGSGSSIKISDHESMVGIESTPGAPKISPENSDNNGSLRFKKAKQVLLEYRLVGNVM